MTDPSTAHPWFTAAVAGVTMGVAGLAHEVPSRLPSWSLSGLLQALTRKKELPMNDKFKTALVQLHGALEFGVKVLPGSTKDEKSAAVDAWLDPLLAKLLEDHGVDKGGTVETAVVSLFNIAAAALVGALFT